MTSKTLSATFYLGWLFVWIAFLFPEMQTRIAAISATGNIAALLNVLPFIIFVIMLVVPIYLMLGND